MPGWLDTLLMVVVLAFTAGLVVLLGIGGYLVWRDSKRGYGKWGVNPHPIFCPRCGEPAPVVRIPANWRQMLWGGATCSNCACEYDKWGKPIDLPEAGDLGRYRRPPAAPPPSAAPENVQRRDEDYQEGPHA
jgi:hypothetical protein